MGSHIVNHETKLDETLKELREKAESELSNQKLGEEKTRDETFKNYTTNKTALDNIFELLNNAKRDVHNEKKELLSEIKGAHVSVIAETVAAVKK